MLGTLGPPPPIFPLVGLSTMAGVAVASPCACAVSPLPLPPLQPYAVLALVCTVYVNKIYISAISISPFYWVVASVNTSRCLIFTLALSNCLCTRMRVVQM